MRKSLRHLPDTGHGVRHADHRIPRNIISSCRSHAGGVIPSGRRRRGATDGTDSHLQPQQTSHPGTHEMSATVHISAAEARLGMRRRWIGGGARGFPSPFVVPAEWSGWKQMFTASGSSVTLLLRILPLSSPGCGQEAWRAAPTPTIEAKTSARSPPSIIEGFVVCWRGANTPTRKVL